MSKKHPFTSHEGFSHDSIESLGYDWERIGDPTIKPRFPTKVYLPRTTDHVVAAVKESRSLGQTLRIRSKGHSSNNLVLVDDGSVLCTEMLNRVLSIDENALAATVQSGSVLADVDAMLSEKGLGLPVIGDHNHITAGGFAAVGGISPASHRFGLFIDNVIGFEYVDWQGAVHAVSREHHPELFKRVMAGTGRDGVIATLTLKLVRIEKWTTILRNRRLMSMSADAFIAKSHALISAPQDVLYERGVWLDLPIAGRTLTAGQFSSYYATPQGWYGRLRRRISYGYLHFLGRVAGRLPRVVDLIVKYLGIIGIIFSPRYGTIKDIESFTDKVIDSSVGDPTRMFVVLAPVDRYQDLFRAIYGLCKSTRARLGAFTFISLYVKAIESSYLSPINGSGKYAELMLYCGVRPAAFPQSALNDFVDALDTLVVRHGALRYMHTRTVMDADRLRRIDPNEHYR